jgi:DNA-binding NtrC family response regulator
MACILVVEDEPVIRSELRRLLVREGHEVSEASSVAEVRRDHQLEDVDLIITDVRLPGEPGTSLIEPEGPRVLAMTSYATVRSAVEAMKLGAAEYLSKPFDNDEFLAVVERLLRQGIPQGIPRSPSVTPAAEGGQESSLEGMVGSSAAMADVFERIRRVAATPTTVLVLGESGTGKELVARAIHAQSSRRAGPFVPVNCAAVPDGLIESDLFGHEKGAFTGAVTAGTGLVKTADGGTLFLDEIGDLAFSAQAALLRFLQESEVRRVGATHAIHVDVRLIAATHRDLPAEVRAGRFREDLYFRLRVAEIRLPPLRERPADLRALAAHLLAKAAHRLKQQTPVLCEEALQRIERHSWPGNVRELENALERAVVFAAGQPITAEHLALEEPWDQVEGEASLVEYFKRFVLEHQGKLPETQIARRLGISRKALWERRIRFGIPRPH